MYEEGSKLWRTKGEEQRKAKKHFIENMKLLENELGQKHYFGGEDFGFLDIALVTYAPWFHTYQEYGGFNMEEEVPKLMAWTERCKERESVSKVLPDPLKVDELSVYIRRMFGID